MRESIVLASPSRLLTIHLRDKECSFWLSPDRKSLMIEEELNRSISGVEVKLARDSDRKILASLNLPISSPSSLVSLRLDGWLSLMFENDVTLNTFDPEIPVNNKWKLNHSRFTIVIHPIRTSENPIGDFVPTMIYSDILKIGSTTLAVSRELLSLHSEFFTALFYGCFAERNQEVKEIKEIAEPEFVAFLQSLHKRRFEFTSVRNAVESLEFADRFLIPEISKKVLPYLKKWNLSINFVEYAFTVAARVHNNQDIITWLLPQIPSKSRLIEILHDSAPFMSTEIMQMCLRSSLKRTLELESTVSQLVNEKTSWITERRKILSELEERNKELAAPLEYNYEKMKNLMDGGENADYNVGFHLIGHNLAGKRVDWDDYVYMEYYNRRPTSESYLWKSIPKEYTRITINGVPFSRDATVHFTTSGKNSIVKVEAYRN